jgi:hypothetical protein
MIDTMIHDALVAHPEGKALLDRLTTPGEVALVTTHLQQDQLGGIPDDKKRNLATAIKAHKLPTVAAVWDVSRWDEAEWGSTDTNTLVEALARNIIRGTTRTPLSAPPPRPSPIYS